MYLQVIDLKGFCPCCCADCWAILKRNAFSIFFFFPAMTSTVNGFPKQCVPHIELIRWNMGRHTKLRTKSGSKKWELSLEKKKILQLEAYDNVLCHWGASWPEFGCHGFTFDYAGFLIFLAWFAFFACPPAWATEKIINYPKLFWSATILQLKSLGK